MTDTTHTDGDQIPLILIHGAWLSARSWENYADYFAKRGFRVSAPSGRASRATLRSCARPLGSPRGSACRRSSTTTRR